MNTESKTDEVLYDLITNNLSSNCEEETLNRYSQQNQCLEDQFRRSPAVEFDLHGQQRKASLQKVCNCINCKNCDIGISEQMELQPLCWNSGAEGQSSGSHHIEEQQQMNATQEVTSERQERTSAINEQLRMTEPYGGYAFTANNLPDTSAPLQNVASKPCHGNDQINASTSVETSDYSLESHNKLETIEQSITSMAIQGTQMCLCKECGEVYPEKTAAVKHIREKHPYCDYTCNICGFVTEHRRKFLHEDKSTFTKYRLAQHLRQRCLSADAHVHLLSVLNSLAEKLTVSMFDNSTQMLSCTICNEICISKQFLYNHMKLFHTRQKSYICSLCAPSYISNF